MLGKAHPKWWHETEIFKFDPKGVFSFRPDGEVEQRRFGGWSFPSSAKSQVDEGRPIALKTRFFDFPHRGETKKHPWDRIRRGRFYTSILGGFCNQRKKLGWRKSSNCVENAFCRLSTSGRSENAPLGSNYTRSVYTSILGWFFQAAQKAGLTKVVQLRWKRVFSTFHIGAKRKSTLGIEFYEVGFIPPFWVGFSKQRKKPGWRRSSDCVEKAFFRLSPSGRNEKTPLGSNSTRLVLYLHFGLVFASSAKSRVDEGRPIVLKTRFVDFPHRGEAKKHPWDRILRGRFIPPFWGCFSKQRKKPGWRRSSNCVENEFFRLSTSGRNEKAPLGSNSTRSVLYLHFGLVFPSSAKSRVEEGRPIALKTRFFDFPHRGETKKHPWERILRGRFHTSILGWFFQAAQKAGLTKVVQLRWKRVFSTFPIGAKRKSTLGIEFYEVGLIPLFWVGFSKQRKKPGWRRSSNCVENAFFLLSPSGRNEKAPLGWNSTRSVSYLHFALVFPSIQKAGLTKVVQLRWKRVFSTFLIGAKRKSTLGIEFYEVGFIPPFWVGFSKQRKKLGWRGSSNCVENAFFLLSPSGRNEKAPLGSNSTRSVSYLHFGLVFPSSAKSWVDEGRPIALKTRFFCFPHRGETKKHHWDRILRGRFHTSILGWFFPAFKKRVEEGRPIALKTRFFDFPYRGETKKHPWDWILRSRFHTSILGWFFKAAQKAGLTRVVQLRWKRVFSTFPIWVKRKNTLRIEFHEVGFIPPFWVGFSKQGKKPGWRTSSNCVQNAFFRLSPSGGNEKTPLGSNSTRSVSYHHFEWAFPSRAKSRVDGRRPIAFKTRFFDFPHRVETKQHHWDRILRGRFHTTILSGLFQAGQKAGLTNVVQLRSKRVFSTFPIGAKRINTLGIEFHEVGLISPFWVGFSKQGKKPGWRTSSNCVQNAFFRLSPSGRNETTTLGSNSTRSVSYHHFEWAFPSRAKSRVHERRPIAFKTRFFDFPNRGETKQHPWDRIPRGRFHTTILSGLFQAGQKPGWRTSSNCVQNAFFRLSPSGRNEKTPLGSNTTRSVSYHHFEWAFPSRAKSRVEGTSSNCVQNAFFRLSPSGRNEKTPLGLNTTRSVSYHHFELAFPSRVKSRVDERRPIAFKTRFFDFPHRGETKQHPWDRIPLGRFHTIILSGLFQAGQKAGLTNVVQLRSKRVFLTFPIGAKRKNTLRIEYHEVGFIPPFWVGFSKQGKKPGWRTSSNCVQNAFFDFPHRGETKKHP